MSAVRPGLPVRLVDEDRRFASLSRQPRADGVHGHRASLVRRLHGVGATRVRGYRVRLPREDGADGRFGSLVRRPRGVDAATRNRAHREAAEPSENRRAGLTSPPMPKGPCEPQVDLLGTTKSVRHVTYSSARGELPCRQNSTGGRLRLDAREARDEEDWKRPRASLQGSAFAPSATYEPNGVAQRPSFVTDRDTFAA